MTRFARFWQHVRETTPWLVLAAALFLLLTVVIFCTWKLAKRYYKKHNEVFFDAASRERVEGLEYALGLKDQLVAEKQRWIEKLEDQIKDMLAVINSAASQLTKRFAEPRGTNGKGKG